MTNVREEISDIMRKHDKIQTVMHYINKDTLKLHHKKQDGTKAIGVDGVTKGDYARNLDVNIDSLITRMKSFSYKPQPTKRVFIDKDNGGQRPLGIPSYEDKLVQGAMTDVLNAIYEPIFCDFSYGFREGKNCHQAIKVISDTCKFREINFIIDADIKGFFDNINHDWMMKFLEHEIQDKNFLRYIKRFLKSGVIEVGELKKTEFGTPQGGVISPVLANIYLHYVLDIWFERQVKKACKGEAHIVRYADDFVCLFQYKDEAIAVYQALLERLNKFGLEIAEDKTRIIPFGKYSQTKDKFDFLGFTFINGKTRNGRYRVVLRTNKKKMKVKKKELKKWIRSKMHIKLTIIIKDLNLKLKGHYQYYGISGNMRGISEYYEYAVYILYKTMNRRSQRKSYIWEVFKKRLEHENIAKPRIRIDIWGKTVTNVI